MLQRIFDLILRPTEPRQATCRQLRAFAHEHPDSGGLRGPEPVLGRILAGDEVVHERANEPPAGAEPQLPESPAGNVIRLMPRRRPEPERHPDPPAGDDDDPGPSAA